jgi:hypothetical protein
MKFRTISTFYCAVLCAIAHASSPEQSWLHFTRIGAYGLRSDNAAAIVKDAQASGVFGIEVDNDITGRYESFLDPTEKLKAIRTVAEQAHRAGNRSFVYIAGTECITAHAEKSQHSVLKDHPDWLQRKITGEPALFTSGAAFWIRPGDEDVWISPYAVEWRETYMQRVREISATGIDGIYVDIPYWMTHFDGWENTWASFDEYTVNAFRRSTGLDARHDLKLGDFADANFRKWIDFRISTLTDFVSEIGQTARSVNPAITIIPEIYPGIEDEAVRVGADVYEMYGVADAIAHEYEFGGGDHMASSRSQLDWFLYQGGMLSFRAFAQGKPTWLLNYSWDGDKGIAPSDAMKNLAMSQIMVAVNVWDAPGHSMAGSNDIRTRTQIFKWIAQHEKTFYSPRSPLSPVGVYFSPKSRNFDSAGFLPSYRGTLLLLLQKHLEVQVVTPRTIAAFRGHALVLPDVSILNDEERSSLREFLSKGGHLVITGTDATGLGDATGIVRFRDCPAKSYFEYAQKDFAAASQFVPAEFLATVDTKPQMSVEAPPTVAANIAVVNGKTTIFFANFSGLVPHKVAVPTPQAGVRISTPATDLRTIRILHFLGETQTLHGQNIGDRRVFTLPTLERGAVAWFEDAESIH